MIDYCCLCDEPESMERDIYRVWHLCTLCQVARIEVGTKVYICNSCNKIEDYKVLLLAKHLKEQHESIDIK